MVVETFAIWVVKMIGFGLFVGTHPEGDQVVGVLLMFAGIAQTVYAISVGND